MTTAAPFVERIRHRVIPAVPVPFDDDRDIDEELQQAYIAWMDQQPIGGVAVWAHTGRGMQLSAEQRERVLLAWRSGLETKPIVCGVGVPHETVLASSPGSLTDAVSRAATELAEQALSGGADAVLAHPPKPLADLSDASNRVLEYHRAICSVGIPVIAFFLYEEAGGLAYSPDLVEQILTIDGVIGIKVATLDSIMTYQDILASVERVPGALPITGEDRFLGYSLAAGAGAALIGLGAALSDCSARLLAACVADEWGRFFQLSRALDAFSQATFVAPMEGYVQRMLWALEADGVISRPARDPWSPALSPDERERVFAAARILRTQ